MYLSRWSEDENYSEKISLSDFGYSKKSKIYYFVSNDNSSITLYLRSIDRETQNSILNNGLITWFNMDNSTDKIMGVRFPLASQYIEKQNVKVTEKSAKNIDIIELIGFKSEEKRRFPSDNSDGISGFVKIDDNGCLIYKLIIKIEKLPARNSRKMTGTMPFSIGVELNNNADPNSLVSVERKDDISTDKRNKKGSSDQKNYNAKGELKPVIFWIRNINLASGR
jgi:hypothetical protein